MKKDWLRGLDLKKWRNALISLGLDFECLVLYIVLYMKKETLVGDACR